MRLLFLRFIQQFGAIAEQIDLKNPSLTLNAKELDSEKVQQYLLRVYSQPIIAGYANFLASALLGCGPNEISALYLASYIKSGGGDRAFDLGPPRRRLVYQEPLGYVI